MKQITKNTLLKQGDKTYQPVEVDGVIYWIDKDAEKQGWCIYAENQFWYLYGSGIWDKPRWSEGAKLLHSISNDIVYTKIIAQSQPKLEGISVIVPRYNELDTLIWFGLKFTCEEECQCHADCDLATKTLPTIPYYTQKDIEKAIELAKKSAYVDAIDWDRHVINFEESNEEILEQINYISVIEVDEQFNILSYE